ncbi:sensor histidine kinase [Brucella intermedia]|uniref:sensor histidine kinase n=1 Tax=Brucella intermedia TaxID=94625 RepID=UPI0023624091|nr:sensor histidine kinase [Brucella intermedia]
MNERPTFLLAVFPYVGLTTAILLGCWSFFREDNYRAQLDVVFSQTSEIQWRVSRAREKVAHILGYLQLPQLTPRQRMRLVQDIRVLDFNLRALLGLGYVEQLLSKQDLKRLRDARDDVESTILPLVNASDHSRQALERTTSLQQSLFLLSNSAADHEHLLSEIDQIETEAAKNRIIFELSLCAVIIAAILIHQRGVFARRRDRHFRSFSSLFAHMTRTRISALCLFLRGLSPDVKPDREMIEAAHQTAMELNAINDGLMKISYSGENAKLAPLCDVLLPITTKRCCGVKIHVDAAAKSLLVPASQIQLIVDELVLNAEKAVWNVPSPRIEIGVHIRRHYFFRHKLIISVADNGVGMPADVLKKAIDPFFSTRAGSHVGLGLTSCSELLKSIAGKLIITSTSGAGTEVRVEYPIVRNHRRCERSGGS